MIKFNAVVITCVLGLIFTFGNVRAQSGKQSKQQLVQIDTEYGSFTVVLYNSTPAHRDNFIKLTNEKFFDTLSFNRIIKNFVVQGGDPDSRYIHKETLNKRQQWMKAELNDSLYHKRGALGMGRDDNEEKKSFSTQFYLVKGKLWTDEELDAIEKKSLKGRRIPAAQREVYKTVGGLPHLDGNYTVFGEVLKGMEVLDKLSSLPGDNEGTPYKKVWMKVRVSSNDRARQ